MIARAYWLALMLTARLAYAQDFEGVQVIGIDNARVNVIVTKDSAFLSMRLPDGSSFAVRTDSVTMATLADNADLMTDTAHGARIAYVDAKIGRMQAITFVRLSADSNSGYRLTGEDGSRTGTLTLAADSARVLFGAMRGEPQKTRAAGMMHMVPGLVMMNFQVQKPLRERYAPKPRYPETLRSMNIQGDVILGFIVDSTGHLDRKSIQVLHSTDPAFTRAAEESLVRTDFDPAELNGHPVAVRTQQRYAFTLTSQ